MFTLLTIYTSKHRVNRTNEHVYYDRHQIIIAKIIKLSLHVIIHYKVTTVRAFTLHIKLLGPSGGSGSWVFHLYGRVAGLSMAHLLLPMDSTMRPGSLSLPDNHAAEPRNDRLEMYVNSRSKSLVQSSSTQTCAILSYSVS
jgi:hypothetical protein